MTTPQTSPMARVLQALLQVYPTTTVEQVLVVLRAVGYTTTPKGLPLNRNNLRVLLNSIKRRHRVE